MKAKWSGWFSLLVIGLWAIPLVTSAQGYDDRDEDGRGPIEVTNDWRDEVQITMWTHRRERIGGSGPSTRETLPSWRSMEAGSRSGHVTRSRLGTIGAGSTSGRWGIFRMASGTSTCAMCGVPPIGIAPIMGGMTAMVKMMFPIIYGDAECIGLRE